LGLDIGFPGKPARPDDGWMTDAITNIDTVLDSFDELWSPRILARVNDWKVLVVKVAGEFVWHSHPDTDELFVVLDGDLDIHLRDAGGSERVVALGAHDTFVVPRGVEHRPVSGGGARLLLMEPAETVNTGDYAGEIPDHITSTTGIPVPSGRER
jgi:mannose-6-phosphate isomerase-like protein (cupin superfamily)